LYLQDHRETHHSILRGCCGGRSSFPSLITLQKRQTAIGTGSEEAIDPLRALAEALQVNTTLKILNIKNTALLDASNLYGKNGSIMTDFDDLEIGVEMLGSALTNNRTLTSLVYGMNNRLICRGRFN
jgi:hypothetical protein